MLHSANVPDHRNQEYYWNGSINQIPFQPADSKPYNPYPSYASPQYQRHFAGKYVPCQGADGSILLPGAANTVSAYDGVPEGFPEPDTGSFEAVGLDKKVCFDRYSRLGVYGLENDMDFSKTKWLELQNKCTERNKARYQDSSASELGPEAEASPNQKRAPIASDLSHKHRTAILIRTWDAYEYRENDIQAIRSMVTELNLLSGGEYHVFLFVNVKDITAPVFTDEAVHEDLLRRFVPEELRDIAVLWTEAVCQQWYTSVGEHSVYMQQWMPIQWFSQTHPEFEYIWNWEMDARYIGNHYHFLEQVARFAKKQPRKYLWERNARYYFPAAHGSYESFVADTNRIVATSSHVTPVWGPQPWTPVQTPQGPTPPHSLASDDFTWGVDEEAAFITLLPMWDPRETFWSYRDKLWGYPLGAESTDERPYPHIPRRTFINTFVRLSKTLLDEMHRENLAGVSMVSEMWPASTALHHGLKAVYAPHPIWMSQKWPKEYLDPVFNAEGWGAGSKPGFGGLNDGRGAGFDPQREEQGLKQNETGPNGEGLSGRWMQERDAPYNPDREHNFGGWSWYFWSDFPKVLYWRWLGWKSGFSIVTIDGSRSGDDLRDVEWSGVSF